MTWIFWLAAAVLVLLALAFVLPPLLRAGRPGTAQSETNRIVLRRRLQELETERAQGELGEAEYREARADVERQALEQVTAEDTATSGRQRRWGAAVVLVMVPVLTVGVYWRLGGFETLQLQEQIDRVQADRDSQLAFIRENIGKLERRVEANPEQGEAWVMLGRSYMVLERYQEAVQAFDEARQRLGDQPQLLLSQAEAAAYAGGESGFAQAAALTEQVLAETPQHPRALWFAGMVAMERGEAHRAAQYWQRLRAQLPADSPARGEIDGLLAELEGQAQPQPVGDTALDVTVRLDPALAAGLAADTPVFVFAKAVEGPPAPLAVQRATVGDLPLTVNLSAADAMVPQLSMERYPQVRVEARVSRGGTPEAQSGDLEGASEPVDARQAETVTVTINRRLP